MDVCFASVPHIAHGEHQVRECRELNETICPIALILACREILQFATQSELLIDLIFTLSNTDIRLYHATLTFDDSFVVVLVHVHEVELKRFANLLLHLHIDILIV